MLCAVLCIHQDVLPWTSASRVCVCITEQLGHLLSGCLLHAICALQGPVLPCPGRQLDAALYREEDNACSIWVEGVTGEKRVAVLSPWSVSPLACARLRCAPHQYRDPKCSDRIAAAAD